MPKKKKLKFGDKMGWRVMAFAGNTKLKISECLPYKQAVKERKRLIELQYDPTKHATTFVLLEVMYIGD